MIPEGINQTGTLSVVEKLTVNDFGSSWNVLQKSQNWLIGYCLN